MTAYGPWHQRPWWVFWRTELYRRAVYASPMIGGGWDGWEYSNTVAITAGERTK